MLPGLVSPYDTLLEKISAPSTFAATGWYDEKLLQSGDKCLIQHHRSLTLAVGVTHISLLHSVFGEFMEHCRSDTVLDTDDNQFVINFCMKMSEHYEYEDIRRHEGNELLNTYPGYSIIEDLPGIGTTGGTICWDINSANVKSESRINLNKMVLLNIEYKNEIGSGGGDPFMQNVGYFVKWLSECKQHKSYGLYLPSFLVSIVGPLIAVYGVVAYGQRIHCDPLTPYFHLLPVIDDNYSWRALGRSLRALKLSLPKLHQYYSDLVAREVDVIPGNIPDHPYPYLTRVHVGKEGDWIEFTYVKPLGRRVFLCTVTTTGRRIVLKYIQSVQDIDTLTRGQRELATIGSAPELIAVTQIPPDWTVTVSEFIDGASYYDSTPERDSNLVAALNGLHSLGIVHGDIRKNNVLVVPNSSRVIIVDFDFTGLHNVGRYPDRLNQDIRWPPGVRDGAFLRIEHDNDFAMRMMEFNTTKLQSPGM